jgi:hypothetical protein
LLIGRTNGASLCNRLVATVVSNTLCFFGVSGNLGKLRVAGDGKISVIEATNNRGTITLGTAINIVVLAVAVYLSFSARYSVWRLLFSALAVWAIVGLIVVTSIIRVLPIADRRRGNRLIGTLSSLAFLVCGLVAVSLSSPYRSLRGFGVLPNTELSVYSIASIVVGGFSVVIALIPSSWVEKVCKIRPGKLSSVPVRMLGGFAAIYYLLAAGLWFTPHVWDHSPRLLFSACPACVLTGTFSSSPTAFFLLLLAPLSAAVYGSLGAALGYVIVVLRQEQLA